MTNRKTTVTIAVSAFNEEHNIAQFLNSIYAQVEKGFIIEKILIILDGSTDRTFGIVKSFKSKRVEIIKSNVRMGKSSRLNQIYKKLESDILVQSDADVIFSHPHVVRDIIQPIIKNKRAGMCGGNPQALDAKTLTEKAINLTVKAYYEIRTRVRGGHNVFSADGRLLAFRKEFIKQVAIPSDMIANDMFTYFCCKTKRYSYHFVKSAIVFFRSPQTLSEHIKQNTRFNSAPIRMSKYFPASLVQKEMSIPKSIYIKTIAKQVLRNPLLCTYIFLVNILCKIRARMREKSLTAKWPIASSSKKLYSRMYASKSIL